MRRKFAGAALRIALVYGSLALLWVLLSDRILTALLSDHAQIDRLQSYKGWAFVIVTAGLLYVTLRKQLRCWEFEAAARIDAEQQSARYRFVLSHSRDSILLLRRSDGQILEANVAATITYGFSRDELLARTIHDLRAVGTEALPYDPRELEEHGVLFNTVHRRSDGSTFPVELSSLGSDVDGTPVTISVVRDITERERNDQQLRLRDAALATAANGVVIADRNGTIVWVNAAFSAMTGYRAAEAIGQNPRMLKSGAHDERFYRELWRVILSGNVWRGHVINRRKDGSLYDEDMMVTPVVDKRGGITHFIAIKQDITDRKRAEEETLSVARFLSENPHPILRIDRTGVLLHANDASFAALPQWHLEKGRLAPTMLREAVSETLIIAASKTIETEQNGRVISFFVVPIPQAGYANLYGQDITERKRAEQALLQHAAELRAREQQNLRLVSEVKKREEDLRENDRRKDEFLAMLSHELRNPLAPIRNVVETPRLCASSDCAWASSIVEQEVTHLARLLDDLLDVSRITRSQLQLRRERVSLNDIVDSAVKSSFPFIRHNDHDLTVTLPEQPIQLNADRVRLVQVFVNLLNNAAKYTGRGGKIRLRAECQDNEVIVSVKDNGSGIDPDKLPYVFDIFYQANRSHEQTRGGLGIGLTLVKRLVELQGGNVEANSAGINRGSEFIVRLPVLQHAVEPVKPNSPLKAAPRRRILVVDDYPNVAESMARRLTLAGHEVQTAFDGLQALATAEEFRPEIILLDIGMPKLDGYETARRIRRQPWGAGMMLVALTGWGQDEDRRLSREAGFDAHLVKPVDKNELAKLLAATSRATPPVLASAEG